MPVHTAWDLGVDHATVLWLYHTLRSGEIRFSAAKQLGLTFQVRPDLSFADGINAVRLTLPKCYFDEQKCAPGLESLR